MFAKLKKKIAEEAAIAPRPGGAARIPRTVSKESITSAGADSGDDFASDGSSSREDMSSQLFRRNDQIRKLEAKLSASMRKLQEQNEVYQANRAKMAEGMALALEKKDQEWQEKLGDLEKENRTLSATVRDMREQNVNLFLKRDDFDELEGFQQQELAKVKHMLIKKEESLMKIEKELEDQRREASQAKEELQVTSRLSSSLNDELTQLQQQHLDLEQHRDELLTTQESAEKKITELEHREQELQDFIQQLSLDLQKAQVTASTCEKTVDALRIEYEGLKQQHQQYKHKMMVELEEKDKVIQHLHEKISSLEKRLEGNFSGDDHMQELLKEKTALEQKLDDSRQQLSEARTNHTEEISVLETRITQLNNKVIEGQTLLGQRRDDAKSFKERSQFQLNELEQTIKSTNKKLKKREGEVNEREAQIQRLKADLEAESNRLQQQMSTIKHQCAEKVNRLETQIASLETAREFDKTAAQHKISQLEQENEDLKETKYECENSLKKHEAEHSRLKEELSSRETVSVEIAKALEEVRKRREELQQQVTDFTSAIKEKDACLRQKHEEVNQKEEIINQLRHDHEAFLLQMKHLQCDLEMCRAKSVQGEESSQKQLAALRAQLLEHQELLRASKDNVTTLEEKVRALNERLYPPETEESQQNGDVSVVGIAQLQAENLELEQQILEKNKVIKQLQQRMAELKKTLLKELKLKPENDVGDGREKTSSELANAVTTTVTNNSDLNDSREINFEYLKHVVLKFMSCRETEAFHLIKAVSVLLNFSRDEENMLKETLEYKMSWFGSKPAPKGIVRPSISSPRTPWS
ncbi:golgin subfamily A member 1 isoform X2 [Ambystoma mexicanum]|uniref:golgin subfamily A member 1 isoform X2 n=1 Tax=Ambystoma mexicanum TaxID=8296 RepID=UPI0037E90B8D